MRCFIAKGVRGVVCRGLIAPALSVIDKCGGGSSR